jgi:hypothetical protein
VLGSSSKQGEAEAMAKNAEIQHEYHAGKDKLKISIQGYALESKTARDKIMRKLMAQQRSGLRWHKAEEFC